MALFRHPLQPTPSFPRTTRDRPAVFLDRDDTIIANRALPPIPGVVPGDLCDPARVELLPGAAEACSLLLAKGYALIVVSNQGVVARGGGALDDVHATCERMAVLLERHIGRPVIEACYVCPFHPQGKVDRFRCEHNWRKPAPGMILAAVEELGLDLGQSWAIGDSSRDVQAAAAAGIDPSRCIQIGLGGPPDLLAAARHVPHPPRPH